MQQANQHHAIGSVFIEQKVVRKLTDDPFANLRRVTKARFGFQLQMSGDQSQSPLNRVAEPFASVRVRHTNSLTMPA